MSTTYEGMRNASCTSCQIQQDLSNYWIPQLYYQGPNNGSFEDVSTIGGMTVYYLQRGENVTAFPPGFRMLAGNPSLRSYSDVMEQAAINFVCLDYDNGSSSSTGLPTVNCPQGLRAQIVFPSCWNGVDLDSANHKSHMAYPNELSDGTCPDDFPVRLVTLFYEVTFVVDDFSARWYNGRAQPFVFAMGDPTGYGLHGDMINGWDETFLQSAIDTCLNGSGLEQDCPLFDLAYGQECHITPQVDEIVSGSLVALPGCNPVQFGPGVATPQVCTNKVVPTVWNTTYQYEGYTAPPTSHFLADQAQTKSNYSTWEYIGCFSDQATPRTLPFNLDTGNITVESCLDLCRENEYPYGGLESGSQCWCGNTAPANNGASSLTYADCATSCQGNSLELCGGDWALSVYNNTVIVTPEIPSKSLDLSASYVGCYIDNANHVMTETSLTTNQTVDGCVHACEISGYSVSAVEYGGQCYCSNTQPLASLKTADSDCNMRCDGLKDTLCGAGYRLQVYQGVAVSASQIKTSMPYAGCFTDSTSARSLAHSMVTSGTVESCLQTCAAAGYTIAGLEYGGECWCDQVASVTMKTAPATACNMACSGNSAETCGGSNALSIYNSTTLAPSSLQTAVGGWPYSGCWTDDANRVMTAVSANNQSVTACVSACQAQGYTQSAVEYGGQCFCGSLASRSVKAADTDCNMPCVDDMHHLCGAGYRLQVYNTSVSVSRSSSSAVSTATGVAGRIAIALVTSKTLSSTSTGSTTTSAGRAALVPQVTSTTSTSSSIAGRQPLIQTTTTKSTSASTLSTRSVPSSSVLYTTSSSSTRTSSSTTVSSSTSLSTTSHSPPSTSSSSFVSPTTSSHQTASTSKSASSSSSVTTPKALSTSSYRPTTSTSSSSTSTFSSSILSSSSASGGRVALAAATTTAALRQAIHAAA